MQIRVPLGRENVMSSAKSACSILPPHIFKHIMTKSKHQGLRDAVWRTLLATEQFRGQRAAIGAIAPHLAVPAGEIHRTVYDAQKSRNLPGQMVRSEGDGKTADISANEAYDN